MTDGCSDAFSVSNGVEQDYVLAPTQFNMMLSVMLFDAFRDSGQGVNIKYRTVGKLFKVAEYSFLVYRC